MRHDSVLLLNSLLVRGVSQIKVRFLTQEDDPGEDIKAGGPYLSLFVQVDSIQSTFTPSGGPNTFPLFLLTCSSFVGKPHCFGSAGSQLWVFLLTDDTHVE